ncbi:uncharacterized protein LOC130428796 [Triplophysa dalaica]|uniref:uncharacterized protein LOC130428796 n=1 Tax=Triplophysa dalaica TaxID=1582913 RepID=UPI0024DF439D|nr:uncharacterized protein LOC130428796 [Triplophysa dalaica]
MACSFQNGRDLCRFEFERITTIPLVSTYFAKMDQYSAKLMKIYAKRGGVNGQRIKDLLVPTKRDTDAPSTQEAIQKTVMGVFVVRIEGFDIEDTPANVGVVLEGVRVLEDLNNVSYATAMLMGLIYALT